MNREIDELVAESAGRTPDCSGEKGCTLATVTIDLGDPCGHWPRETGHAGIAIGEDFYDTFPGAMGGHSGLDISLQAYEDSVTNDQRRVGIVAFEYCLCDFMANWARNVMEATVDPDFDPTHCSGAVCLATTSPGLVIQFPSLTFWAQFLTTPRGLVGLLENEINRCGADKGGKPNVRVIERP